ncbi:prohead protease/major capsid protein fusion protein [Neorhizobium sp. JUb45]|uniref:prohead protease/major capsid protein fusion protein n=1 Tax=Neorhizobium sp. JUb45 TaxID=2485113 RepID=UPI0010DE3FA0|nr:prohead protease/major capsid protein fusion protein [Neorhizobium sp. JUb45]TCR04068.1 prohead serine protease [Neorhizobium sp. JUb45]
MTDTTTAVRADPADDKMRRSAQIGASSFDEADNTIEVIWTTGAAVRRWSWRSERYYSEVLEVTPQAIRLERLNAGAPFLNTHDDSALSSVIGSVVPGTARVSGGKGFARVKLSRAAEDAAIVEKIKDGIIRNISVGYAIHKVVKTDADGDGTDEEWRVVDWEPLEISAVPVPADAGSQIRSHPDEDGRSDRAERTRTTTIAELAREAKLVDMGLRAIEDGQTVDAFRTALIRHFSEKDDALTIDNRTPSYAGEDHTEKRAVAMREALIHRADPTRELNPAGREYRGFSLLDMARESLELRNVKTRGMGREEIAREALAQRSGGYHATSDFPIILGNVVNTTLRAGYEAAGQTFRPLVREATAANFKAINRAQLGEGPAFDRVPENGEYKRGSVTEGKESYKIATFGKVIGITRQVIINDDMNAFSRIPQLMGGAAAQLESDLVWAQILGNPTMGDGQTLFSVPHKNLMTAAALNVPAIGKMRASMAKQTGLDGKTVLNIVPQFLIVPVELETTADQLLNAVYHPTDSAGAATGSMRKLQIIAEARLDNGISNPAVVSTAIAGSTTAWYLAASPAQVDTVELAYLEGNRGVYIETRQGFDVDGLEVKARLDVGAKAMDHRGLAKNAGA